MANNVIPCLKLFVSRAPPRGNNGYFRTWSSESLILNIIFRRLMWNNAYSSSHLETLSSCAETSNGYSNSPEPDIRTDRSESLVWGSFVHDVLESPDSYSCTKENDARCFRGQSCRRFLRKSHHRLSWTGVCTTVLRQRDRKISISGIV